MKVCILSKKGSHWGVLSKEVAWSNWHFKCSLLLLVKNKLQDFKGGRLGYCSNPNQGDTGGSSGTNVKWSDWEQILKELLRSYAARL